MVIKHEPDQTRVTAAITRAKQQVSPEIRLVSLPYSSKYGAFALLHALIAAAISGFVAAVARPALTAEFVVTMQFMVALIALACVQNRWFRHELVPDSAMRKAAWRGARLTYAHLKLQARHDDPLVLLYCSKLERYVEILVDERVLEKVPEAVWQKIVVDFRPHMRDKREADAFVHLIERTAEALREFFPAKNHLSS